MQQVLQHRFDERRIAEANHRVGHRPLDLAIRVRECQPLEDAARHRRQVERPGDQRLTRDLGQRQQTTNQLVHVVGAALDKLRAVCGQFAPGNVGQHDHDFEPFLVQGRDAADGGGDDPARGAEVRKVATMA